MFVTVSIGTQQILSSSIEYCNIRERKNRTNNGIFRNCAELGYAKLFWIHIIMLQCIRQHVLFRFFFVDVDTFALFRTRAIFQNSFNLVFVCPFFWKKKKNWKHTKTMLPKHQHKIFFLSKYFTCFVDTPIHLIRHSTKKKKIASRYCCVWTFLVEVLQRNLTMKQMNGSQSRYRHTKSTGNKIWANSFSKIKMNLYFRSDEVEFITRASSTDASSRWWKTQHTAPHCEWC